MEWKCLPQRAFLSICGKRSEKWLQKWLVFLLRYYIKATLNGACLSQDLIIRMKHMLGLSIWVRAAGRILRL